MNVVDSSGWIAFFQATRNGPVFKPVIEDRAALLVPVIALYEVHKVLSRQLPAELVLACLNVMRMGLVLEVSDARAIAAAAAARAHGLAMADALMYSMAQEFGATLWTQDVDYQGLPGVRCTAK